MIKIIAAVGRDGAIGARGDLAFHISADLRRFKALTTGNTVVMGRRTFESLPKGALPNRRNIVVSRNPDFEAPGAETAPSLQGALDMGAASDGDIFIIGGGEIYSQAIAHARELHLTQIDADSPEADTFFPIVSPEEWELADATPYEMDARTGLRYRFVTYRRPLLG